MTVRGSSPDRASPAERTGLSRGEYRRSGQHTRLAEPNHHAGALLIVDAHAEQLRASASTSDTFAGSRWAKPRGRTTPVGGRIGDAIVGESRDHAGSELPQCLVRIERDGDLVADSRQRFELAASHFGRQARFFGLAVELSVVDRERGPTGDLLRESQVGSAL